MINTVGWTFMSTIPNLVNTASGGHKCPPYEAPYELF